jgi:hypothetical protein
MKNLFIREKQVSYSLDDNGYDALISTDRELYDMCRLYVLEYYPSIISDENKMKAMKEICSYAGIVFKNKILDGNKKSRKIAFKNELRSIKERDNYKIHMLSVANILLKYKNN